MRSSTQPQSEIRQSPEGAVVEQSESRFRNWVLGIVFLAGPLLLFLGYYRMMFSGLTHPDALDFAQLGRNLSSGQGFVTYILRPLALDPASGSSPLHQPDVTHGPLYPFFLALAYGALGAKDSVTAFVSGVFYLLTIPVLYQLGKRAFSPRVGMITALIFAVNAMMLEYAASGLHFTLYIFLATSLFLNMYNLAAGINSADGPGRLPKLQLFLAGALTGLLYLTDPIFFWIIPAVLSGVILWFRPPQRLPSVVWFLIPLMVLVLPWMGRNWALTGNAIFGLRGQEIIMSTKVYPGYAAYRMTPDGLTQGVGLFQAVIKKILLSVGTVIQAFPQVTASWILAFFLPSLFFRFRNPAANRIRNVVMYCFLAIFVGTVLFVLQMPLFVATVPAMLVFSVAYLLYLMEQARMSRGGTLWTGGLIALAVLYPLASSVGLNDRVSGLKEMKPATALSELTAKESIVFSDEPWIVAWYGKRPSLWLPMSNLKTEEFQKRFGGKIQGLLLTERLTEPSQNIPSEWRMVYTAFQGRNIAYDDYSKTPPAERPAHPPSAVRINEEQLKRVPPNLKPIWKSLNGFTSVDPVGKDQTTVVAIVSTFKQSLGSRP